MTTLNFGATIPRGVDAKPYRERPPNKYPAFLPCMTAAVPDKVFASHRPSIEFPHPVRDKMTDEVVTPMEWIKCKREQSAYEVGSGPENSVRAFKTPRYGDIIIYQMPNLAKVSSKGFPIGLGQSMPTDPKKALEAKMAAAAALRAELE